jgi:hypothetical protein
MQRQRRAKGMLEADREARLENLHPTWSWDPYADQWEEGFSHLRDYIDENGHAHVRQPEKFNDYPLGRWVLAQRQRRAKGRLEADRERRLQGLPGWTWRAGPAT